MVRWSQGRREDAVAAVEALEAVGRTLAGPEADLTAAQLWTLFGEPSRAAAALARVGSGGASRR